MSQLSNLFIVDSHVLPAVVKKFGKSEETLQQDVEKVKDWLKSQPHFPEIIDDKSIQNFLLLNKCDIEETKTKLKAYYAVRSMLPCFFERSNPKSELMQEVMEAVYLVPLPKLTKEMYRVIIHRVKNKDKFYSLHPYDVTALGLNIIELRLKEDVCFGDVYIVDCRDIPLKYCLRATPRVLYNGIVSVYQGVYSSRMKGWYILNAPRFVEKILAITKLFVKPKLFKRIHVCNEDTLKEIFPKDLLPKEYGGEEKSMDEIQEMLKTKFQEYQNRFDKLDQMRTDENLTPTTTQKEKTFGFTF